MVYFLKNICALTKIYTFNIHVKITHFLSNYRNNNNNNLISIMVYLLRI